jgi:cell division protein FtsW (lipid II flippase)
MRWSVVKVLLALFILVSGFGMQMVSSASPPQQNDGTIISINIFFIFWLIVLFILTSSPHWIRQRKLAIS